MHIHVQKMSTKTVEVKMAVGVFDCTVSCNLESSVLCHVVVMMYSFLLPRLGFISSFYLQDP